jgi:Flp pilus assembly protein TadG
MLTKLFNFRNESGSAIVIVAVALAALLGFTALVIDGGRLYSEKSKLQKALDAAVLAGAQGLRTSESDAKSIAKNVSQKNGYSLTGSGELTVINNLTENSIEANKQITVSMTLAKVLGMSEVTIGAKAKALVAPLKKANGIAPIAISESDVPMSTELNCGNPGAHHGNCGFIDLNASGASGLADGIKNGGTFEIGTKIVETEPGDKWGPVKASIQYLIDSDASKTQCQSKTTADNSCNRVIDVVVIKTWEDATGKSDLTVVGLASYWIEKIDGKKIIGQFIKSVDSGEVGTGSTIGEFNLYGVKLIE